MKTLRFVLTVLMLFTMGQAYAEDSPMPDSSAMADMMAKMAMAAVPGPEHEFLKSMAGSYTIKGTITPSPGAEPITFDGESRSEMILGDRFLLSSSKSGEGAMYTETHGILGFDRRTQKFTTIGLDTWGTYYVTAEGVANDDMSQIVLSGEDYDPIAKATQVYDFIYDFTETGFIVSVVFYDEAHTGGAESHKMVEMVYTKN